MKTFLSLLLFLLLAVVASSAEVKRNLTVDDLFLFKNVSDPEVSPDGKWVAYVVRTYNLKEDKSNRDIYMIPFSGGEPIQVTGSEKEDRSPRWSPDNKYLAFLSKRSKDKSQVFLLNRSGGEAVQLTNVDQGVEDFSWSPDSKRLALVISDKDPDAIDDTSKEGGDKESKTPKPIVLKRLQFLFDVDGFLKNLYDHIYTFDIQSKSLKQITSGPYEDAAPPWSSSSSTPRWSPDGKQILFISDRSSDPDHLRNSDLFVVSSDGGEPKKLTTNPASDESPVWSPDGKWIAYLTNVKPELIWYETVKLAIIPSTGGSAKLLTETLDRNVGKPSFSTDGQKIYFLLEDEGTQRLASVSISDGKINRDVTGEKVISDYDLGPSGSSAFIASRPQAPDDLFAFDGTKTKQLVNTNQQLLDSLSLGQMERIHFKSKDGTPVEAFVTKPPNFDSSKKYPAILWIHGGPTSQYEERFDFGAQLFAANGYVVLYVNPRGSTGYGENFCKAIWADWGNKDYDDVMAGVDYVIAQGYVDPNKLGVGGWSYGGILTDHVITKTDRFKAATTGASESNYLIDYGVDHYQYEWEKEIGLPWEKPENYIRISPFFKLGQVVTPTLVLGGESDLNVPLVNSEQLYQGLRRRGIDTMLIVYPGQPHGITKPSYQKDRYQRYLAWYGHFLQGAPEKEPPATPEPAKQGQ